MALIVRLTDWRKTASRERTLTLTLALSGLKYRLLAKADMTADCLEKSNHIA
jgi:hypothetical protein